MKTSEYYKTHPEARKKHVAYQKKYNASPAQVKRREELNKANRKAGTYGNGDGLDMSHTRKGTLVKEKASTNRARQGAGNNRRLK